MGNMANVLFCYPCSKNLFMIVWVCGLHLQKVIPLKDITCVRKAKTAGVFPNAIEITSWGKKVVSAVVMQVRQLE